MSNQDWLHRTFHAYESKLVHYAWSIVGDMETARDIAQDTFLKLCRETPATVGDPPKSWLYKICRNRAIDHYRKNKRRATVSVEHAGDELIDERDANAERLRAEQHADILSALATLPEREQEIVRLKFLHDFSYKQISVAVGLSVGNVGYILHGALVKLREQVANGDNSNLKSQISKPQPKNSKLNTNLFRVFRVFRGCQFPFQTPTGATI